MQYQFLVMLITTDFGLGIIVSIKYWVKYQNIDMFYFPRIIFYILGTIRLDFWKAPLQLEGKHHNSMNSSSTNNHYKSLE